MLVKTKLVFYCSHCRKHGLSRHAMEKHETHCTLNPDRICRWKRADGENHPLGVLDLLRLVAAVRLRTPLGQVDIDWLREEVAGCPACMLAALRQSGVEYHYPPNATGPIFDYTKEVERFRAEEREEWEDQERWAIESTWL